MTIKIQTHHYDPNNLPLDVASSGWIDLGGEQSTVHSVFCSTCDKTYEFISEEKVEICGHVEWVMRREGWIE